MIKSIIIGKYTFPLTDECANAMLRAGKDVVERPYIRGTRIFTSVAEVEAQAFADKTGFNR